MNITGCAHHDVNQTLTVTDFIYYDQQQHPDTLTKQPVNLGVCICFHWEFRLPCG